jgi:hypothetical protein
MDDQIKEIIGRIERLEKMVLSRKSTSNFKDRNAVNTINPSGPKGGTLLLIEEGLFKKKQSLDDVKNALEKNGYMYHKDVVRNTLSRLSTVKGPLVLIKEEKSKVYVERK